MSIDRDINVGSRGITGHYATMIQNLRVYGPSAIQIFGIWLWVLSLPPDIVLYRISPHITLALILNVALLVWTVRVWWQVLVALWYALRWAGLEMDGLEWTRRNDNDFRVTYYRVKDGSLKYDQSTRVQRLDQELQTTEFRRSALLREGAKLIAFTIIFFILPAAYVFSYELMSKEVYQFLERWNALFYIQWLWFYVLLVPLLVSVSLTIFENFVYWSGAQFIAGAKMRDPVIPDKTLETMRLEEVYGGARFVDPSEAAKRFSD
jgi:hypothetical protein